MWCKYIDAMRYIHTLNSVRARLPLYWNHLSIALFSSILQFILKCQIRPWVESLRSSRTSLYPTHVPLYVWGPMHFERGAYVFSRDEYLFWFIVRTNTCAKITRIRYTSIHSLTCINMCFSSSDEQKLVTFWTLWYSYSSSFEPARMPVESQWTFLIIPIFRVPLTKQRKIFFFQKKIVTNRFRCHAFCVPNAIIRR